MLQNIHIKNIALIDEIDIDFGEKLNILTGETGAGKSIIIGSVNLALGKKLPKDIIRSGAESALVELLFSVDDAETAGALSALGIEIDSGEIVLTRRILPTRSICRINGETVSVKDLQEAAALLIDIHGQNEHRSLLSDSSRLEILDHYGHEKLAGVLEDIRALYRQYTDVCTELKGSSIDNETRNREMSLIEYEIKEITAACLREGEDDELETAFRRMNNSQKIMDSLYKAYDASSSGRVNIADLIGTVIKELRQAAPYDEEIESMAESASSVEDLVNDLNRELGAYIDGMTFDEETYRATEERLDLINRLKSKYGRTIGDIVSYKDKRDAELEKLAHLEDHINELKARKEKLYAALTAECKKAGSIRKEYAKVLEAEIGKALKDLNFADARFEIRLDEEPEPTPHGTDRASFMISANKGEQLREIQEVASGGELSRIMLAVKSVLAGSDNINTLIFDEIDAGISGRTAQRVAEKLSLIAKEHQVICITHLPQIASMADDHYLIEKSEAEGRTVTHIEKLDKSGEIEELARMTGGAEITENVLSGAREMKLLADKVKNEIRA